MTKICCFKHALKKTIDHVVKSVISKTPGSTEQNDPWVAAAAAATTIACLARYQPEMTFGEAIKQVEAMRNQMPDDQREAMDAWAAKRDPMSPYVNSCGHA